MSDLSKDKVDKLVRKCVKQDTELQAIQKEIEVILNALSKLYKRVYDIRQVD